MTIGLLRWLQNCFCSNLSFLSITLSDWREMIFTVAMATAQTLSLALLVLAKKF